MVPRLLLIVLFASSSFAAAGQGEQTADPPVMQLFPAKKYAQYQSKPKYKDRMDIYREVLDDQIAEVRSRLKKLELARASEILLEMRAVARHAMTDPSRESANPKDFRSKQVKKLEIRIRKMVGTLDDLKLGVPYDYRSNFEETAAVLEKFRDQLLQQLFGRGSEE